MIPKSCKRLAEADFPIAEVSRHAAREKEARCGHIPKIHIWPAARPTASSRAVLLGLLWPDPCDPLCPTEFKEQARKLLPQVGGCHPGTTDEDLRKALLKFIADFANWDKAAQRTYLDVGRALVKTAHGEELPLVVDPFAGGGSIPLEAMRLGCEAFASDLNPVACLILKVVLEDVPRHGPKLADELRRLGDKIKQEVQKDLADLYPKDSDGATPITYLWARTVLCESPNCGAEIPLMRSLWLCKKARRKLALRHRVLQRRGTTPRVEFEVFEPRTEKDVLGGTVTRAKATCLCCGTVLPPDRVRAQLAAQRGGADVVFDAKGQRTGGARLLAVVLLKAGETGRRYRPATEGDYAAVSAAVRVLQERDTAWRAENTMSLVPDETISLNELRRISIPLYGMQRWGDLFTTRQRLVLGKIASLIARQHNTSYATRFLALNFSKMVDMNNALATWQPHAEIPAHMFTRNAIPMKWDFAEAVPLSESSGTLQSAIKRSTEPLSVLSVIDSAGSVQRMDAGASTLPDQTASVWFTDPPYYDAVPYSYLSDFFYVWLRRALAGEPRELFSSADVLKDAEIVVDRPHSASTSKKDVAFYELGMARAFAEGRRVLNDNGIGCVVFAHKTTEGWEALLSGMIRGGWTITASWPVATEMGSRLNARDTASLATSVHLICRPRPEDAGIGDWADVLRELPLRVGDWMERLQGEGVRGADLVFACIGPALEIFSRHTKVEAADGRQVSLAEYLEKVWEVVGRSA
ncbi:MAG: DUF1156 domain-containing protein, partial [Chloroflexi bacterium]|nr:DUF1156 domain-containing protein [Chloroflexota bacterium]